MRRSLAERLAEPGLRLRALSIPARISLVVLVLMVAVVVLAPWVGAHDPFLSGVPGPAPERGRNWFGTDVIGRDIFARVVARRPLLADDRGLRHAAGAGRGRRPRLGRRDREAGDLRGADAHPRHRDELPRHRPRRRVRRGLGAFAAGADLRDRLPLHPAAHPGRPGQRAGPVRRGLRRRVQGHGRADVVDPRQARHPQLHRPDPGVRDRAGRRRDRLRGIPVVHQRRRAAARTRPGATSWPTASSC